MPRVERLKRQLVKQAVQENLDLLEGRGVRRPLRRRRSWWRGAAWGAAVVLLLSAGILASSHAVTGNEALPLALLARGSGQGGEAREPLRREAGPAAEAAAPSPAPTAAPSAVPPPSPAEEARPAEAVEEPAALSAVPRPVDPQVFPLAVRRVVLDPGHGGTSLGTRTPSGLTEKEVTLDIARRLQGLLAADGFDVRLTRQGDSGIALEERARLANEAEADLFVSIHVNWIEDTRRSRGVETYYLGTTDDPYLNELAAMENRESGYSLADMRHLLDRIYSDLRVGKSRELAQSVQAALFQSLAKINPQLQDRGVKTAPFLVLVETEMPAILAEVSCLSNEREADLLSKPLYRQFIAEALARGIRSYAGDLPAAAPTAGP